MGRGNGGTRASGARKPVDLAALYESYGQDASVLLNAAGYTGKPKLVDELDTNKAWKGVILHRGVENEDFAQQLKEGEMHYGGGFDSRGNQTINALGKGIYTYAGGDAKAMTKMYGQTRVDMILSKSAKVADYNKLTQEMRSTGLDWGGLSSDRITSYAISKGYHAIHRTNGSLHLPSSGRENIGMFGKADIVVVLDRRKLMIKK